VYCTVPYSTLIYCTVLYCTVRCRQTERISGVVNLLLHIVRRHWAKTMERVTDTFVPFLCLFGEGTGCHSLFCSEEFQCLQFCAVLVQVICSWRSGATAFCPIALRITHWRQPYKGEVMYVDVLTVICYSEANHKSISLPDPKTSAST